MSGKSLAGLLAGMVIAGSAAAPAIAQDYPTRPITVIVPFAAGGPTDTITRIVGEHMSRTLGQQLVVENVVGAGGTTASTRAKRATPDGYTIITGHMGTHAAAVGLYPNLAYDPRTDFEPIGLTGRHADPHPRQEGFPRQGPEGVRRLSESERRQAQ